MVVFKYKKGRKRIAIEIPDKYARAKAIDLAEQVRLDKITDVTYTVEINGLVETRELDYFNDIL